MYPGKPISQSMTHCLATLLTFFLLKEIVTSLCEVYENIILAINQGVLTVGHELDLLLWRVGLATHPEPP